jgi:hypothetical protein
VTAAAGRPGLGPTLAATAVAATLSGAPSTVHSLATRRPVLATVRAAATLVRGAAPGGAGRPLVGDLVAGGLAHSAVSLFWGAVLARTLPPGRRALWGAAAGIAIHVLDLGVIARIVPRLAPMRALPQLPQLGDHVAFGFTFGLALDTLGPATDAPVPAADPAGIGRPARTSDQATSSSAAG